jgi:hypothetical protein
MLSALWTSGNRPEAKLVRVSETRGVIDGGFFSLSFSIRRRPAPAKLDALTLGDEEQIVPELAKVLIVEGQYAESTVLESPDKRC